MLKTTVEEINAIEGISDEAKAFLSKQVSGQLKVRKRNNSIINVDFKKASECFDALLEADIQ